MPLSHMGCRGSWEAGSYKMSHAFISHCCCCSVAQSVLTLCNPMSSSTPGFPVLHCLLEFAQTHVRWVGDDIQPSHPLSPPSPLALNFPCIWVFLKLKKNFFLATLDLHGSPQAQLPCSMWDLSSPARNGTHEGGFLTTGPPEKSHLNTFKLWKRHATSGKIRFYRTRIPLQ